MYTNTSRGLCLGRFRREGTGAEKAEQIKVHHKYLSNIFCDRGDILRVNALTRVKCFVLRREIVLPDNDVMSGPGKSQLNVT